MRRKNELTSVYSRNLFDETPGGVDSAEDIERWLEFRYRYHQAQALQLAADFPLQIDFELTSKCNMACSFCTHGHQVVERKVLPFKTFARIIDEGEAHGLVSIKLNYINEPLLVRDLPRYVAYARSRGVLNVYFATNGSLLDKDMARALIEAGVSKLMVSLDAATAETFRVMRNSDKFDVIVENIYAFLAIREELGTRWPLLRVNFLKTDRNEHEAESFVSEWTGVADMIGFQDRVGLPGVDGYEGTGAVDSDHLSTFRCSFPFKLMVVDSSGDILPCCTFSGREMPMANVESSTVKAAWDSSRMVALRKLQLAGRWRENAICAKCVGGCS